MLRSSVSRRVLVLVLAACIGVGIGLAAVIVWATPGGHAGSAYRAQLAAVTAPAPDSSALDAPAPDIPPAPAAASPSPLTPEEAQAVATQASPGTVVDLDQDTEPTGLVYGVKIQHADGTESKVEVDATTGQVVSVQNDDQADGTDPVDAYDPADAH